MYCEFLKKKQIILVALYFDQLYIAFYADSCTELVDNVMVLRKFYTLFCRVLKWIFLSFTAL